LRRRDAGVLLTRLVRGESSQARTWLLGATITAASDFAARNR
jgi:hypothetical protein